jgi:hypothetical protein
MPCDVDLSLKDFSRLRFSLAILPHATLWKYPAASAA